MTAMWSWCGGVWLGGVEREHALRTLIMCGILCYLTVGALCPDTVCVEARTERGGRYRGTTNREYESRDVSHNVESHNVR